MNYTIRNVEAKSVLALIWIIMIVGPDLDDRCFQVSGKGLSSIETGYWRRFILDDNRWFHFRVSILRDLAFEMTVNLSENQYPYPSSKTFTYTYTRKWRATSTNKPSVWIRDIASVLNIDISSIRKNPTIIKASTHY